MYHCPICGGTNVQVRAWVDANTNEYICDCEDGGGFGVVTVRKKYI